MGITSNTTPLSRFSVEGHAPSADFEDWVAARLPQHGFENIDEGVKEQSIGWTTVDDVADGAFTLRNSFYRPPYVCFSLRRDERKVPRTLFNLRLEREYQEWLAMHPDMKWVPKSRKAEIKDLVHHAILTKTMPQPKFFDAVWNVDSGVLHICSLSAAELDTFYELFAKTFPGYTLKTIHPYACALRDVDPTLKGALTRENKAGSENVIDLIQGNLWLGSEFFLWLAWSSAEAESEYKITRPGPGLENEIFVAHLDKRLVLVGEEQESPQRITFAGPQKDFPEVRTALKNGMRIAEAMLFFEKNQDVWQFTLKGDHFRFGGLKTPKVKMERDQITEQTTEKEALFYEKMFLIETSLQMFDSLFASFLDIRLSDDWGETVKRIVEWY